MGKIRQAEFHYRKAAEIHPNNAVLLGCVGMVRCASLDSARATETDGYLSLSFPSQAVEKRGDRDEALAIFDGAVRLSPDNALTRYRRAKILIAMKRYEVCLFCGAQSA